MVRDLVWLAILAAILRNADCLHCFQCSNITEYEDCQSVTQCIGNQRCSIQRFPGQDNTTYFTMGCTDNQLCPDHRDFTIVGRSTYDDKCFECCTQDGCNRQLCEAQHIQGTHSSSICADDPATNCPHMSQVMNICSDTHHAKLVCRKHCGLCAVVDGSWNHWTDLSSCSTTCGLGKITRTRTCTNPAPQQGGELCLGNATHTHSCFLRTCPVHGGWSGWAPWERCSESCGQGVSKRHRTCNNPSPSIYGSYCIGDTVDFKLCQGLFCNYTSPNISTNTTKNSTKTDNCQDVLTDCDVANMTSGICGLPTYARKMCAEYCNMCSIVDGQWSAWSDWGTCSTTCGNGQQLRKRTCSQPVPVNGGQACLGNSTDIRICNLRPCPVHGGWSSWDQWSTCSSTCGPGITQRVRSCNSPRPSYFGNNCFGDTTQYAMCLKQCRSDVFWSDWTSWSVCRCVSYYSSLASQERTRVCFKDIYGGNATCLGNSRESQACSQSCRG